MLAMHPMYITVHISQDIMQIVFIDFNFTIFCMALEF